MPAPVLSIAQMREWESAAWNNGIKEADVIRKVGECVANSVSRLVPAGGSILLLAGMGNNGADARAAAPLIQNRACRLIIVSDPDRELPEVQAALAQKPSLVVDALFGIGLNRPLAPSWVTLIETINHSGATVLSIDTPSGLNADSGRPEGAAIRATVTLTIGAPKSGMLVTDAVALVGRLEVARDVGLGVCPAQTDLSWIFPEDFAGFPRPRLATSHKGTHGHLAIFAGSHGYHGAASLCARGAQRARPGLITLFTPDSVYPIVASQLQSVMVSRMGSELLSPGPWTAIVVGPGLESSEIPEEFRHAIRRLWRDSNLPVIVDASALGWLRAGPINAGYLRVITPHPGEAARMLGLTAGMVQADRPKAVRDLSQRFGGAWVVLKGHQTIVGQARGILHVNCSGNPNMGQGGSGDLLAGYIGGLLAQPALRTSPGRTLSYAVWQHGASADVLEATRPNWIVEDLADTLGLAKAGGAEERK